MAIRWLKLFYLF